MKINFLAESQFKNGARTALSACSCAKAKVLADKAVRAPFFSLRDRVTLFAKTAPFAALLLSAAITSPAQLLINGAGATFPYPIYSKWFDEYAKTDPSVRFNYQSIGSGGGQQQIIAQTVDFGASDSPMSDEKLTSAPGRILHLPTVAGAVVITYNLPNNPKLKLDGSTLGDIFFGQINQWDDRDWKRERMKFSNRFI